MTIALTDMHFVYSGGIFNEDPNLSIGGLPSPIKIETMILNNLFDDITGSDPKADIIDYRAIYVLNNS